jgi:outer membrane protein TolC
MLSLLLLLLPALWAQTQPATPQPVPSAAIPRLTLEDAIRLARKNAPQFRAAVVEAGIARQNQVQARAAILPGLSYTTGAIYTQPNGTSSGIFVAANGPQEYLSYGVVHESLSFTAVADYQRAQALSALAKANAEIAARGLVATVVKGFYDVVVTQNKYQNAQAAATQAQSFVNLSENLENGGEVAHSDVVKAQLQANDRERDVQDSRLAAQQAKLGLAVLIFPSFTPDYELVNDLEQAPSLPDYARVQELAGHNDPEITSAHAAMKAAEQEVASTIGGHLPSISFDYFYGIDANRYAISTNSINNLGYQVSAALNLPVFDWGAVQSRVKQAQLQRDLARVELSAAQRTALANLRMFYDQAQTARNMVDLQKRSVELAGESLRLTTLRYQAGEATALEVVDAQNAAVLAQNDYDDWAERYHVAIANLQTLTGSF